MRWILCRHSQRIFFLFIIKQKNFNQTSTDNLKNQNLEGTEFFFRFPWKPQKGTEKNFRFHPFLTRFSRCHTHIYTKGEPKKKFGSPKENRIWFFFFFLPQTLLLSPANFSFFFFHFLPQTLHCHFFLQFEEVAISTDRRHHCTQHLLLIIIVSFFLLVRLYLVL